MSDMKNKVIALMAMAMVSVAASAFDGDSIAVVNRVDDFAHGDFSSVTEAWKNPALFQFRRNYTLTAISAGYDQWSENEAVDVQRGDKDSYWAIDAETYLKYRGSTIWGHAGYQNGKRRNVRWNETSDYDIVKPFILGDPTGGDMKREVYSFGGGYANRIGRSKFFIGASLAYTAGLYSRNVDPRPKNVTSKLDFHLGVGLFASDDYLAALSLQFVRYRQSNDVTFYSELGNEKLYHLTGLGNHYARFAGTGYNTKYKGRNTRLSISVYPFSGRGMAITLALSGHNIDNELTDLNKLPMGRSVRTNIIGEVAWLGGRWEATARARISRLIGRERIFGDPASGVYPEIGTIDMYHNNEVNVTAIGVYRTRVANVALVVSPSLSYNHSNEIYADPKSRQVINDLTSALRFDFNWHTRHLQWNFLLRGEATTVLSSQQMLNSDDAELKSLRDALVNKYELLNDTHGQLSTALSITYAINTRYALGLNFAYEHTFYTDDYARKHFMTSLSFYF